jgi:hypothetical protein
MKLFNQIGAVVSLALLVAGVLMLWKHGLSARGISSFVAASVSGFSLSVTLQVFALRRRIDALEKARQGQAEA